MKKAITLLLCVGVTAISHAQFSFGLQGIMNLSSMKIVTPDVQYATKKMKIMPGGGAVVQYSLSNKIAIRSGLNFLMQGTKINIDAPAPEAGMPAVKATGDLKLQYLQIPAYALYTVNKAKLQLYAGAGPYFNYGIGGEINSKGVYILNGTSENFDESVHPFKSNDGEPAPLKKLELGVGAIAGLRWSNGLFVNVGYQLGLTNNSKTAGDTYKNRGVQLSLGYFFK